MKRLLPLLAVPILFGASPNLENIKSVYLLPMTNGIDQYLANHLRTNQVVSVTTDPQAADAILTDSIGPAFERRMLELYPPPPPEKPKKAEGKESEDTASQDEIKEGGGAVHRVSAFRKGRGVVFLVDRRSKQVVWSTHQRPRDATAQELDRAAGRMSASLKKDYGGK